MTTKMGRDVSGGFGFGRFCRSIAGGFWGRTILFNGRHKVGEERGGERLPFDLEQLWEGKCFDESSNRSPDFETCNSNEIRSCQEETEKRRGKKEKDENPLSTRRRGERVAVKKKREQGLHERYVVQGMT